MQENEQDILRRVRKIEIKTRGLSDEIFAGKYHTAFRGRGMSFSEVRGVPRRRRRARHRLERHGAFAQAPHQDLRGGARADHDAPRGRLRVAAVRVGGAVQEERHDRNRGRAGFLRRAEQRQGGLHLLLGQGREVHPAQKGPQPYLDDYPRAGRGSGPSRGRAPGSPSPWCGC